MTTTGFNLETNSRTMMPMYAAMVTVNAGLATTHLGVQTTQPQPFVEGFPTQGQNLAKLSFVATGAAEENQIEVKLYGTAPTADSAVWTPSFICEVRATFGTTLTGNVAPFGAADLRYADAIELLSGDTSVRIVTDTGNGIASITLDLEGASYLQAIVNKDGLTFAGTTYNAAVSLF
jgi:hypothetical protein